MHACFHANVSFHLGAPKVSTPSTRAEGPLLYLRNLNHSVRSRKLKVSIIFTKAERFHQPYTANHVQFLSWLNNIPAPSFSSRTSKTLWILRTIPFHGGRQPKCDIMIPSTLKLNRNLQTHTITPQTIWTIKSVILKILPRSSTELHYSNLITTSRGNLTVAVNRYDYRVWIILLALKCTLLN